MRSLAAEAPAVRGLGAASWAKCEVSRDAGALDVAVPRGQRSLAGKHHVLLLKFASAARGWVSPAAKDGGAEAAGRAAFCAHLHRSDHGGQSRDLDLSSFLSSSPLFSPRLQPHMADGIFLI